MEHKCKKSDSKTIEKCELNREQIIKALECCFIICYCNTCPYYKVGEHTQVCTRKMAKDVLALIKEQEQKIFELENRLKECENGYEGTLFLDRCKLHDAEEKVKELTEENERLRSCVMSEEQVRTIAGATIKNGIAIIKADTVRKMQSEIKERCIKGGIYPAFVERVIDQIAKELLEGE